MDLYPFLKNQTLGSGYNGVNPPLLTFYQGDTVPLVLHGMQRNPDTLGDLFLPAHIDYATLQAAIMLLDAPPKSGTFKVQVNGTDTTSALAWNVSKADFVATLNLLASVSAAGGLVAIVTGPANIFGFIQNDPTQSLSFAVVENKLAPFCLVSVQAAADIAGKFEIKLSQAPVAYTNQFSLPTPPSPSMARVRAGSASANEIQRLIIPDAAVGGIAFVQNDNAGEICRVDSTTLLADITAALNDPFTAVLASDVRFSVTNPASGAYDIEFIGAFAKASQSLLVLDLFDQTPQDAPTAWLPVTSQAVEDLLNGSAYTTAKFIIVADDAAGKQTTLCCQDCTIIAEGLSPQVSQAIAAIATYVQTVYVYPSATDPAVIAKMGQKFTPSARASQFVFTHNFGTYEVDVTVLQKTAISPDSWQLVPDLAYDVSINDANTVEVTFKDPVPASGLGSIEVWVCTLNAVPQLNNHRHPTDQVDGVGSDQGKTLTQIIAELRNSLPTGWPNIPAAKISGILNASQIDLSSLSSALQNSGDFLTTIRTLASDPTLVENVGTALGSSATFSASLKTLIGTSGVDAVISASLKTDASFMAAVRDMFTSLLATGGVMPGGVTLIQIADLSEQYPASVVVAAGIVGLPPLLPTAVDGLTNKGALSDAFPSASTSEGWYYTLSGKVAAPQVRGLRARKSYPAGTVVVSDGDTWYEASVDGQTAWPREMERRLLVIPLTEAMFAPGTKFAILFTFSVSLIGNCAGQYMFVLKTGVPRSATGTGFGANLQEVDWDGPIIEEPILLSSATVFHTFGLTLSRALDGAISGTATRYAATADLVTPPSSPARIIYAALERFDTEDVAQPTGQITLKMTGAKASIVPL